MNPPVSPYLNALEEQLEELEELEEVRKVLITTVLEARAACEAGSDRPRTQLLLSAAVKDVESIDDHLHTLRCTVATPRAQPAIKANR